ncbi:transcriptional regulator [Vibrio vulnificus]
MSLCVAFVDGVLQQSPEGVCEYILLSQDQVTQLVNAQFDWTLLEFDQGLYEFIITQSLVTFIGGHALGRILKYFGKR